MSQKGQRLFNVAKISVFLDNYQPGVEKRRGEEVNVLTLSCRVQPFDAKLASALDLGVGGDCNIKPTVFSMNTGEPKPNFTRHNFNLGLPRQDLVMFASSDTPNSRIALTQVRVHGTYVRTQKDMPNALAFVFKASFGPVGRDELEFVHHWFRGQQSITFQQNESPLEFDDQPETDEDDDEPGDATPDLIPPPEFDTHPSGEIIEPEAGTPKTDTPEPARTIPHRHKDRKTATRAKQHAGKRR